MMVNNPTSINKTNNISLLNSLNTQTKSTTYNIGNPGPGLGLAQKCDTVKLVNGIPTLSLLIIVSPTAIHI
jgi:hypothetical protein